MSEPKTLLEAIQYFSDPENCRSFMVSVRWADEVVRCPRCGYDKVAYMEKAKLYFCPKKHDRPKFSLKVGTIFEDSPIALEKWLPAAWLIANCKNGISSYELARAIGVTQKSAWHILHRLRKAMKEEHTEPMGGAKNPTEADECFLGGKPSNMHPAKRMKAQQNGQHTEKAIVFGLYERNTRKVRAKVIPNVRRDVLQAEILSQVAPGVGNLYRCVEGLCRACGEAIRTRDGEPHQRVCEGTGLHSRDREFLVTPQAFTHRHLCFI
jgi:hypothetical protein